MKCCDLKSGMLKEPVTFQREVRTSDGVGGYTKAWENIASTPTRAFVRAVSGHERYSSQRVEAMVSLKVTVRYFSGLLESDAILIRGKRHNIQFINNIEFADKWLEISVDGGGAA